MGAKAAKKGSVDAIEALEALDGPLTVGRLIAACREGEEETLSVFGKRLGVSASHLHDVEKGRRTVSVERAARWAKALGYPVAHFVQLALQAEVAAAGLDFDVELKPANVNSSRKPSKKRAAG